jgi:hypothetical protein
VVLVSVKLASRLDTQIACICLSVCRVISGDSKEEQILVAGQRYLDR